MQKNHPGKKRNVSKITSWWWITGNQVVLWRAFNPENQWVKQAKRLPWQDLETDYAKHFKSCGCGEVGACSSKQSLAWVIVQWLKSWVKIRICNTFWDSNIFQTEPPFNIFLMTYFRKRLSAEVINRFNEKIIELARKDSLSQILRRKARKSRILTPKEPKSENAGTILMDATCAPANIRRIWIWSMMPGNWQKISSTFFYDSSRIPCIVRVPSCKYIAGDTLKSPNILNAVLPNGAAHCVVYWTPSVKMLNVKFVCPDQSLDVRRKWLIPIFWSSNWPIIPLVIGKVRSMQTPSWARASDGATQRFFRNGDCDYDSNR